MFKLPKISRPARIFCHHLLRDTLGLLTFSLFAIFIAEAALPGIISARINITYVILATVLIFFLVESISVSLDLENKPQKNRWVIPTLAVIFILLTIQALYRLTIFEIAITAIGIYAIFFLLYKEFFAKK
jgi:hypothetical protein